MEVVKETGWQESMPDGGEDRLADVYLLQYTNECCMDLTQ